MQARKFLFGAAVIGGAMCLSTPADALVFFDPLGTGVFGNSRILDEFDWAVGNTLAEDGTAAVDNFILNSIDGGARDTTFTTYYHATLQTFTHLGQGPEQISDVRGVGNNLTIVVGFQERVFSANAALRQASFVFDGAGPDFLEIYLNDQPNGVGSPVSDLGGVGFNDGRLLLKADITSATLATFQVNGTPGFDAMGNPIIIPDPAVDLDGNLANNYPDQLSLTGGTQTTITADILSWDEDFFRIINPDGMTPDFKLSMLNNLGLQIPFDAVDPSQQFVTAMNAAALPAGPFAGPVGAGPAPSVLGPDLAAATFGTVGRINGDLGAALGGEGGPDIIFQTDTNQTFNVDNIIPEPLSATLGFIGLGVLSVATRRRTA